MQMKATRRASAITRLCTVTIVTVAAERGMLLGKPQPGEPDPRLPQLS